MNIQEVRKDIVETIEAFGFYQPDADPTERRGEPDVYGPLRFKIGTSTGEVAVTVLADANRLEVIRIISDRTWDEGCERIADWIRRYRR